MFQKFKKSVRLMHKLFLFLIFFLVTLFSNSYGASPSILPHSRIQRASQCRDFIRRIEDAYKIPKGLLLAIAKVESSCQPWVINAKGRAYRFQEYSQAVDCVRRLSGKGVRNLNIGFMQLHFPSHRKSFGDPITMLDPQTNILYAANLLIKLKKKHGSWLTAIRYYHSGSLRRGQRYFGKVSKEWQNLGVPFQKQFVMMGVGAGIPLPRY